MAGRAERQHHEVVVAVGAPKEGDYAIISEACPACGEVTGRESRTVDEIVVPSCAACGAETTRFGAGPDDD